MQNNKITMFQAGIIFSISVIVFLIFSYFNPFEDFYIAGVAGEVVPILIPPLAGLLIFRKSFKINLKLNRIGRANGIVVVFLTLFIMPAIMMVNAANIWLVRVIFGQSLITDIPIPETGMELLISILVIGLVAAVCEEIMFRGVLQSSLEKLGKAGMFLVGSLLFAAFHFSIEQFAGIFVLSLLISYVVYRTNSIFAGMLAHFTNNSAAMVMSFFAAKFLEADGNMGDRAIGFSGYLEIFIIAGFVMFCTVIAGILLYALYKQTKNIERNMPKNPKLKVHDVLSFLPGVSIMVVVFVFTVAAYIFMTL